MIRGTTPTLEFALAINTDQLAEAFVTIQQDNETIIEKTLKECKCEENVLSVRLTQEDTLKMLNGSVIEIQIRGKTLEGDCVATGIFTELVERILKDGVI